MLKLQTETSARTRNNRYTVAVARNAREVEEAQRLRYRVFFEEMGAAASNSENQTTRELDIDEYDSDCEHLIVRDQETLHVVGCYRIMRPEVAKRRGAFYSDSEFDLARLHHLRGNIAEVGRACIHPGFSVRQCHHAALVRPRACDGRKQLRIRDRLRERESFRWSRQRSRGLSRVSREMPRTS